MNNKKRIVNLKYFREMLYISPRLHNQTFDELPFEGSFAAVIYKCLNGKSTGYDSLRLSQAKILWGMYHKKNVDFAYLLWEDFVYQVEHKDAKKSNEMYYPRFTKTSEHMLPVELTNEDIRNSAAYKEYYAIASGSAPPKTKASVRKTRSSSDTTITPPTTAGTRLSTSTKGKQPAKSSKAKGLSVLSEVAMTEAEQMKLATKRSLQQTHISQDNDNDDDQDTDNDGDDFVHPKLSIYEEEAKDEESFDPIVQTPEYSDDGGNDDASLGMNVGGEEGQEQRMTMKNCIETTRAEDDDEELYRDVNINMEGRNIQMTDVHTTQEFEDTHVTITLVNPDGQQQSLLRDEAQAENEEFLNNLDENIQKIIKEQVKVQVSKILSKIEKTVNEQLEAEVLTRSSNSSKTSYVMAADLSKMELKKILIEKMERNKRRDDADENEEPSAGSDRGSKRRREGKEPESTSAPKEKATKTSGKSTQGSKCHQKTASESAPADELLKTTQDLKELSHQEFKTGDVDDQPIAEASQHPEWFQP
nr:hypothetical protein [Tanacetum cinerariifolium]